jgi:hypothetical protein
VCGRRPGGRRPGRRRVAGLIVKLAHLERGVAALAEAEIQARVEGDHIKVDQPASEAERVTRALVRKRLTSPSCARRRSAWKRSSSS